MTIPSLTLDISRLLSRSGASAPSGIDRVELAYAQYLLREVPERTEFAALHPFGRYGAINLEAARSFIGHLTARWSGAGHQTGDATHAWRQRLQRQILLGSDRVQRTGHGRAAYLLLSHHHLNRPQVIVRTMARQMARHRTVFIPMVHDLIPSDYPEYARPNEAPKHVRRLETVAKHADGIIVPSETVRQALLPYLHRAGRAHVPICAVPHGVHEYNSFSDAARPSGRPYFVCLGTIEPRKNHLLLLNVWRRLVEVHGAKAPRLVLIGRRGWENENAIDMLERCQPLKGVIEEHSALPDAQVTRLLQGARALLCPSFAEGFGLPLTEALALGVNVICSDIPVFREVCGNTATFLDPLDGLGWIRTIERHGMAEPLPRPIWQPHSWEDSIRTAMNFIESVTASIPDVIQ
jgi:glycosyltransferase involved in cell wall biosynthesis